MALREDDVPFLHPPPYFRLSLPQGAVLVERLDRIDRLIVPAQHLVTAELIEDTRTIGQYGKASTELRCDDWPLFQEHIVNVVSLKYVGQRQARDAAAYDDHFERGHSWFAQQRTEQMK